MSDEHPIREEQRPRRASEQTHGELAGPLDPFMRQISVKKIGEVGRLHTGSEANAVIGQRLVVIAGEDADSLRRVDDQVEYPKQDFKAEPPVVEQVAEEDDAGAGFQTCPFRRADQRQRRLQGEQVSMQVADNPQRTCSINGGDLDGPIGLMDAIGIEQQARPAGLVEQRFHPFDNGSHAGADARRIDGPADRLPVEIPHVHHRRARGRADRCGDVGRLVHWCCVCTVDLSLRRLPSAVGGGAPDRGVGLHGLRAGAIGLVRIPLAACGQLRPRVR